MFRHYLMVALRNLLKHRTSAFINVTSLTTGMAVALLTGLWVVDELTFNSSHDNYQQIGQVMCTETMNDDRVTGSGMPIPLSGELRSSYSATFELAVLSTPTSDHVLASGSDAFTVSGAYMENDGPDLLSLEMIEGSIDGLKNMNSVLIARSVAARLFSSQSAVGKIINIDTKQDVVIVGVYRDIPSNSDFSRLQFIAPWALFLASEEWFRNQQDDWSVNMFQVYVKLNPDINSEAASERIRNLKALNLPKDEAEGDPVLLVHPMTRWHLYSHFENGAVVTSGEMKLIWFYGSIGAFVLVLACINFMNLNTARAEKRAKEVGIRKSIGSSRAQLLAQFLGESVLTVGVAFVVSLTLVVLSLPWFNQLAGKLISIPWNDPLWISACVSFILFTGLMAGSYPAIFLSGFKPAQTLKGLGRSVSGVPRKALVVFQFVISVSLTIGTIVIYRQVEFSRARELGYEQDRLVFLNIRNDEIHQHFDVIRSELQTQQAIVEMSESTVPVTRIYTTNSGFSWSGKDDSKEVNMAHIQVSHEFGRTIGWKLVDGRDFDRNLTADSAGVVINRSAAHAMGLTDPVGDILERRGKKYKVIGVVEDMLMQSPYNPTLPTIFSILEFRGGVLSMRLPDGRPFEEALKTIGLVLKTYAPGTPAEFKFVTEEYDAKLASETRTGTLTTVFASLAVLISALGLFGLASYIMEQRSKEISIRKVMGASVMRICAMLSRNFILLVLMACALAIPISYYLVEQWLQQFAYRTDVPSSVYFVTCVSLLAISLLTVAFQTVRAAVSNPVNSLRAE